MTIDLLLAYYGDDFTGSTDVLESLARYGIATVLFVEPPSEEMLQRYPHVRAIGVAGNSRTMSPSEMETALPGAFHALGQRRPKFLHYKVSSTFDSSPEIGSIGRAIDIGQSIFQNRFVPLVVAAPALQRFCLFGHLFARSGLDSAVFRLDRHPTMRHHPITPMTEADLRVHLGRQTTRSIELVDVLALEKGYDAALERLREITRDNEPVVLFDSLSDAHLATIGRLIGTAQHEEKKTQFIVGSSGVEAALGQYWQSTNQVTAAEHETGLATHSVAPVEQTIIVSGSCSPVTDRQIGWAQEHGFAEIPVDTAGQCRSKEPDADTSNLTKQVASELDSGRSVILHTSRGPTDPRIAATRQTLGQNGASVRQLGALLGRVLRELVRSHAVRRAAVVGGDTSGQVARSLGIEALEFAGPLEPGAPLCIARSRDADVDGLEIVFKGGQVGYDDFFNTVRCGRPSRPLAGAFK